MENVPRVVNDVTVLRQKISAKLRNGVSKDSGAETTKEHHEGYRLSRGENDNDPDGFCRDRGQG
jgi:hypothetical protein